MRKLSFVDMVGGGCAVGVFLASLRDDKGRSSPPTGVDGVGGNEPIVPCRVLRVFPDEK